MKCVQTLIHGTENICNYELIQIMSQSEKYYVFGEYKVNFLSKNKHGKVVFGEFLPTQFLKFSKNGDLW